MANEGIFITKPGVVIPVATEMSLGSWAAYANNLTLAMLRNTDAIIEAFEAFKFRGYITDLDGGANPTVLFNTKTNYVPNFLVGAGALNTGTGVITPSTVPLEVEETSKVFLFGSKVSMTWPDLGEVEGLRVAAINGLSHLLWMFATDNVVITHQVSGVSNATGELASAAGVQEIRVLEDSFDFYSNGVLSYSHPRTWRLELSSAGLGDVNSTNTQTGSWLAFSATETLDAANTVINGTLTVRSAFGQVTPYQLKLGDDFTDAVGTVVENTTANQAYVEDVTTRFSGGVGTLSYAVQAGSIPNGTSLTSGGLIQGVPLTDGSYAFTIRVTDERGDTSDVVYDLTVLPASDVSYNPPVGIEGVPYSYAPFLPGITGAALASGTLPTGLSLNSSNGALTGTPSADGNFSFTVTLSFGADDEDISTAIIVYPLMTAELFEDAVSTGFVTNGDEILVNANKNNQVQVGAGSGQYQYNISSGNLINSSGVIQIFESGEVVVTVTDVVTDQEIRFTLLVAAQNDICGLAIEEDSEQNSDSAPCTDIMTDCKTPILIGFNAMTLLRGIEIGETSYREPFTFDEMEGATVNNNGKMFAVFRSSADDGFAVANNGKDGKPFLAEFAVDASVASGADDVAVGISRDFDAEAGLTGLDFAVVVTTVSGTRYAELRKANVYQAGSRFAILEGQQVGLAVFPDAVLMYIDGLVKFNTAGNTFACAGVDIVFFAQKENMTIGGRATNIVFEIESSGNVDEVGSVDSQSGLFTPALNSVGLVRIKATSLANPDAIYHAKIRVLKPAIKRSLENALIEGIPVNMWIARTTRFDDLPMRLDREGNPDRNQFDDPKFLGTLAGSGKIEATPTRNEFRNDRGATSTSMTIDKVTISGGFLNVRDFATVKRLVSYMQEKNSNGVRTLSQYSTGCQQKMRVLLIWQSPDCQDVPVFDAIEVVNALSYTTFSLEVGQGVQSQIPLAIEGFPDTNGLLFDYNQFDKHFHRIGE